MAITEKTTAARAAKLTCAERDRVSGPQMAADYKCGKFYSILPGIIMKINDLIFILKNKHLPLNLSDMNKYYECTKSKHSKLILELLEKVVIFVRGN